MGIVGFVIGAVLTVILALSGSGDSDGSAVVFSLGALVFGFGLTTWATALLVGDAIEGALSGRSGWTREAAARAFSIVTVLGFGSMVGAIVGSGLGI